MTDSDITHEDWVPGPHGLVPPDDPDTTPVPVLDVWSDDPTDWLAAARIIQPTYLGDHRYAQLRRAIQFLGERQERPDATRRAAIILNADEWAPELERMLGIRLAVHLEGQDVKCRNGACRRTWMCLPEDPYFDATTAADGLCPACMLAETRIDDAVPVLEAVAVVVGKSAKRRSIASGSKGGDQ